MSKFLNNLSDLVYKCYDGVASDAPLPDVECTYDRLELIREKLDSLGENARRMLEIGIVQDRLIELGFKIENNHLDLMVDKYKFYKVLFSTGGVLLFLHNKLLISTGLDYTSPTWQEELINRVKELIK